MARTRKSTQILNLRKYDVLIEDTATRSDYFKITQFDGYFYGGRNAFLIAGTNVLKPNSKILIEILDVNGNTVYSAPVTNFIEGNSRLIKVEVYIDTPPGPGKIIVLGCAEKYLNGTPIPAQWKDKFNIRWAADVIISPSVKNKTPIRFINTPAIEVQEKFYPIFATASFSQSIELSPGDYQLEPVTYNVFQNGYLIKLINPTSNNVFTNEHFSGRLNVSLTISGSSEIISGSIPITRIINSTTAESRGNLLTSSINTVVTNAFISGSGTDYITSINPYGTIRINSSSAKIKYNKIIESINTGSNVSFAKIRISNLGTLSGEINKIRIAYKASTEPGEYVLLGDIPTQVGELLVTDSGSKIVKLGNFNKINIPDYWYAASMSVSKSDANPTLPNYYFSSSINTNLTITQSSDILLDSITATPEIQNNTYKDNTSYFIGTKNINKFELFPNSEYTLKFNATVTNISSSVQLNQTDYVLQVYLVKQESSSGSALIETNPRGQLIGELTFAGKGGNQLFENKEFNFIPKIISPTEFGLRFIAYGGFWNIANVSLKVAEEQAFSPDEVDALIPNVNFSNKLLTFKTDYLDINNNSIGISTVSTPIYFSGSGVSGTTVSITTPSNNRVLTSDGTSNGIVAEPNLNFDGTTLSLTGSLSVSGSTYIRPIIEYINGTGSAPPAILNYNVLDGVILFYSGSAVANWTLNFRGNASTTLNSIMPVSSSMTVTLLTRTGVTAYSSSAYQIDGTSVTPRWQGGVSASGNPNSIDAHTFVILKISNTPSYLLLGSITRFT